MSKLKPYKNFKEKRKSNDSNNQDNSLNPQLFQSYNEIGDFITLRNNNLNLEKNNIVFSEKNSSNYVATEDCLSKKSKLIPTQAPTANSTISYGIILLKIDGFFLINKEDKQDKEANLNEEVVQGEQCSNFVNNVNNDLYLLNIRKLLEITQNKVIDIRNVSGVNLNKLDDIKKFYEFNRKINFLMIRRKHTLGYIEFIRGNYKVDNIFGLIYLFQQMTKDEVEKIRKYSFDELWDNFWGNDEKKNKYKLEYEKSLDNYKKLKITTDFLNIDYYINNVNPQYLEAEWGFPKGRKQKNEKDIDCAIREFEEETNFTKDDYIIIKNIEPIVEQFLGTNGIEYKHIYYVAISTSNKIPKIDENLPGQLEIGAIEYVDYLKSIDLIRNYHTKRKEIIIKLYNLMMNELINN